MTHAARRTIEARRNPKPLTFAYTNFYTIPAQNLLRTTKSNPRQEMRAFTLSMRMRSANRTPPRTPRNKCYPRWQRGGQGFDPPQIYPFLTSDYV